MEDLFIARSKYTPEIQFHVSGKLSIKGLSLLENSYEMYLQAIDWLKAFSQREPCAITFDLKLEYLDTSSVRSIVNMVKLLNTLLEKGFTSNINWFYEKDDDDLFEIGEAMESVSKGQFNLVETQIEDLEE